MTGCHIPASGVYVLNRKGLQSKDVKCKLTSLPYKNHIILFQPNIVIQWEDWIDTLAGIYQYHLEIRRMGLGSHGNQLTELYSEEAIYNGYTVSGESVSLPSPGLYLFIVQCIDKSLIE